MKLRLQHILFFSIVAFSALFSEKASAQFYNGTQTEFGKNRIQYDDFEWQYYRFNKFETYFYTGGKDLAVYAANYANVRIREIEKFLDFYLDDRIQIIIYNKQSHYRQSNIGLSSDENFNIGGVSKIVGNKLFVYFEGDYAQFDRQLDAGIINVLIYQFIYGGNWRDVLRNSAMLHLPEWYINGLVSYLSDPNNPLINTKIKDGINENRYKRFNGLEKEDAKIAGHAMWQYIAETYGPKVVSDILYMTRVSREIDDGFLYVLGIPFEDLYANWITFFQGKYASKKTIKPAEKGEPVDFKIRKNRRYENFQTNSTNNYSIYSTNKLGKYKIYLYDKTTKKRKKIFVNERKLDRIQDYSYPVMAWHPSGELFSFIIEDKGEILLYSYLIEEENLAVKPIFKMEKVLSYNYLKNGQQLVFSGFNEGQTDLYLYNIVGNSQKKLTDDFYDDLLPQVNEAGNKIFFVSNRPNDSLNQPHKINRNLKETDIFVYDLTNSEAPISSITNTDDDNETAPLMINNQLHYLLHDDYTTNRYVAKYDSAISRIDTVIHYNYFYTSSLEDFYDRNILSQYSNSPNLIDQIFYEKGKYSLYFKKTDIGNERSKMDLFRSDSNQIRQYRETQKESFLVFDQLEPKREIDINDYEFSGSKGKTDSEPKKPISQLSKTTETEELKFPTQRLYRKNFKIDESVLQLNNTFINQQYQLFNGGPFVNSGLGVNTKIGIVDLMEDHRIYGGFRYAGDLIEYSLSYQNLKKRLDKEYMITRTRTRNTSTAFPFDIKTLRGLVSLSWPFSEVTSLRGIVSVRNDKIVPLASGRENLETPIFNEYWTSAKLAYIFDNTRNVALNIRYGTRFKIFAEHYQMVFSEQEDSESSDLTVLGFDFRHYQKLHREIIYVARAAGSRSFGSNPLIYYMGGVDEWWKSDIFDRSTPIDFTRNYGFQALAANMRGFLQNIRNGNNFMLINQEIRVPVFSYFINRPIQSDFLRDFQIVPFGDIGTAWAGQSPYAEDNPLNNETRVNGPITVTYENINNPVVGGFGFGLRSTLLGYFVRADWAWGVENGQVSEKAMFIFSLSLDI